MWNRFQVQRPLSIFLGKRSVTGNDFREDGWQDTRMRKPGALGVVGASHAHSPGAPAAGGRGRRGGEETLEGGPPLPPSRQPGDERAPGFAPVSFHTCAWIRVIFVGQASIRSQAQRTKMNPEEQREPAEVATRLPPHVSTRAGLGAGPRPPASPRRGAGAAERDARPLQNQTATVSRSWSGLY